MRTPQSALRLRRVHFTRNNRASWLIPRDAELAESAPRAGVEESDVLRDSEEGRGEGVDGAGGLDECGEGGGGGEFVWGRRKVMTGHLADFCGNRLDEALIHANNPGAVPCPVPTVVCG